MLSNVMIRIITRVAKRRYENVENIDAILDEYTKLSDEEREMIRNTIIPPEPDPETKTEEDQEAELQEEEVEDD